jgi:uncharacterized protein YqeY
MASRLSPLLLRSFGRPSSRPATALLRGARAYSTEEPPPPPPLLSKLKDDLKTAMRAKDSNRLAVLRGVLAATLNLSKSFRPIKTDAQLVGLLNRTARKCQEAADEARAAGREDLAEKEDAQRLILEEYASSSGVWEPSEDEIRQLVESTRAALVAEGVDQKVLAGHVIGKLLDKDGPLAAALVRRNEVAAIVMELCKAQ